MKKANIREVEPQLAQKLDGLWKSILQELNYPIPGGYRVRVSLRSAKGRKKPGNAAFDNWSPVSCDRAEIWLEPGSAEKLVSSSDVSQQAEGVALHPKAAEVPQTGAGAKVDVHPGEAKLLRALDRAESTPGWTFVSLKRFRDDILPLEAFEPGEAILTDAEWQQMLARAIEKRLILTSKVHNPKSPQFPVTSIRLNRLMPEVKAALGKEHIADLGFHPIEIKGEPLSATIIRARHR